MTREFLGGGPELPQLHSMTRRVSSFRGWRLTDDSGLVLSDSSPSLRRNGNLATRKRVRELAEAGSIFGVGQGLFLGLSAMGLGGGEAGQVPKVLPLLLCRLSLSLVSGSAANVPRYGPPLWVFSSHELLF